MPDDERRQRLFDGDLFVISPSDELLELCRIAESLLTETFAPHDPEMAQDHLAVEEYVSILSELKPRFIHHPECKRLIPEIMRGAGCDLQATYFEVPRLRTSTANGS